MKKVEFNELNDRVAVWVDDTRYGDLELNPERDAWVLWIIDGTDVEYFDDLQETEETIADEFGAY